MFGSGTDEPIVQYDSAGTRSWLTADERGSIVAIADDSGTVTAINTYDEFGKPGASNIGTFQYTGQMWLPELGLYYYKARFYAPQLGRFLQTDPIGYGGDGPNLYAYVLNDPVNYVDPLGLDSDDPIYVDAPWPFGHSGTFVGTSGAGTGMRLGPSCSNCMAAPSPRPQYPSEFDPLDPEGQTDSEDPIVVTALYLAAQPKGERGWAAKPGGTPNEFKHLRPGKKPGWVKYKDPHSGKWKQRPGTDEELAHLKSRQKSVYNFIGGLVPFPIALGVCLLAPSTCGIVDTNNNGQLDSEEIY